MRKAQPKLKNLELFILWYVYRHFVFLLLRLQVQRRKINTGKPFKVLNQFSVACLLFVLTPSDKVVEFEGRGRIEDVGHDPRVEVHALDEHPEDGGDVPIEQEHQDQFADVALRKRKGNILLQK